MIDLANLRFEFEFDEAFEFILFNYYNSLDPKYKWEDYLAARNFLSALKLMDYTYSYIKEIYLFNNQRAEKMLKIFSGFCRNIRFFEHIPGFAKNREEIIHLFGNPMI